jgi:hypothetical protein
MKKTLSWAAAILLTFGTGWGAYTAYRAHLNLVTLNVREVDVRKVVRSIEWQTWERIVVHHDVTGKVTLNVRSAPLERVLTILSEQTSSRWTALYPLYSSRKSLTALRNLTAGNGSADTNGWSALQARGMRFGGGMFGANLREQNQTVSLKVLNSDISVAALALQRFAQAQVLPEDGTKGSVYLHLSGGTMQQAVSRLAKQVDRSWTRFYAMQPSPRFDTARRDPLDGDAAPNDAGGGRSRPEPSPEERQRFEEQFQAQLDTMTPEERQKAEQRRQQWQEIRNLPPAQRRERMAQLMSDPAVQRQMQQRLVQRIKDTTPEQRADRVNQILARRAARAAARAAGTTSGGR